MESKIRPSTGSPPPGWVFFRREPGSGPEPAMGYMVCNRRLQLSSPQSRLQVLQV